MTTGRALSDEILAGDAGTRRSYPRDSSQLLLGLMALSRMDDGGPREAAFADPLEGVISKTILRMLLSALSYRDPGSVAHARRVAMLAGGTAGFLGWEPQQQKLLEVSALVHDVGKIGVPDHILFKPDKLSAEEAELMSLHRNIGIDVLQACRVDHEVLDIVSQANSHFNGATSGFRRIGSDVHQGARILAVADAYDSLNTNQEYRPKLPHDEIIKTLMESAGSRFDGNVIQSLKRWIEMEGLPFSGDEEELAQLSEPPADGAAVGGLDEQTGVDVSFLCHIFSYLYFLESLYDGFYLVDSDLRFVVWNSGAEHLLGHSAHNMLGQVWTKCRLCHAELNGRPLPDGDCPMHRVIDTGKPNTQAVKVQHADGQWIEVELQSVPLFDRGGHLHGVAQIFQDKTRNSRVPEYRELKMAASRDALTGVANRGEMERQLELLVADYGQQQNPEPFSVIFLDIDFFKSINDTYGHTVGDQVLVDLSKLLQHETYSGELISRYGGEEFVILCPGTDLEQVRRRAERLRKAISETQIGNLQDHRVTSSFGVTEIEPGDTATSVLARADKALYISKESGRNRTTALTRALLKNGPDADEDSAGDASGPLLVTETFQAFTSADMIVYKLGGFIDDHRARLEEVTPRRVKMRVGKRGLLPFWGGSDDRRPVQVELELADGRSSKAGIAANGSVHTKLTVNVRPVGWVRDRQAFQLRASRVLKALRSYFAAY